MGLAIEPELLLTWGDVPHFRGKEAIQSLDESEPVTRTEPRRKQAAEMF